MRNISKIGALAIVTVWTFVHGTPATAQTFDDRWSIIPEAHAEPAPKTSGDEQDHHSQQQPTPGSEDQSAVHHEVFSGKASFYAYSAGKTASGSAFNRDLPTAAHRSLPFGTKVRVTDLATSKSVVVKITDRGPNVGDRVLDLSLGAARALGIGDRGVIQIRAEVL
jgi:rare lipoprotein A